MRIFLGQIAQFHFKCRNLSLLIIQSQFNFLNLLFNQRELLIRQISVLRTKLIQIKLLLLSSGSVHFSLLFVDGHVQYLIKVRDSFQNSSLYDIKHNSILEFDCQVVSISLFLPTSSLVVFEHGSISRNNIIKGDRVVFVDQLDLNLVNLSA